MACPVCHDELVDLVYDEVTADRREALLDHFRTAPECARERDDLASIVDLARRTDDAPSLATIAQLKAAARKVAAEARIRARPRPTVLAAPAGRRRSTWPAWAAAATVTLIIASVRLRSTSQPSPQDHARSAVQPAREAPPAASLADEQREQAASPSLPGKAREDKKAAGAVAKPEPMAAPSPPGAAAPERAAANRPPAPQEVLVAEVAVAATSEELAGAAAGRAATDSGSGPSDARFEPPIAPSSPTDSAASALTSVPAAPSLLALANANDYQAALRRYLASHRATSRRESRAAKTTSPSAPAANLARARAAETDDFVMTEAESDDLAAVVAVLPTRLEGSPPTALFELFLAIAKDRPELVPADSLLKLAQAADQLGEDAAAHEARRLLAARTKKP